MESVLVTCATRPFGMRVATLLSEKFEIKKATSDDVPSVLKSQYVSIPKGLNPVFAHELLKTCIEMQCTYVLPLAIEEIKVIAESIVLFEEYGIQVLSPSLAQLADLEMIQNAPKDMSLNLIYNGKDLLSGIEVDSKINGLGVLSDSGEEFILAVSK